MILARDIIAMPYEEVKNLPNGGYTVQFDDGSVQTTKQDIQGSWFIWDLYRKYPETPVRKHGIIPPRELDSAGLATKVMNPIYIDIIRTYGKRIDRERVWEQVMRINNEVYNFIVTELSRWVTSHSIKDKIQIRQHPRVKELIANMRPTESSIQETYAAIESIIRDPANFRNNTLANDIRANLVKLQQCLQIMVCRGHTTDIDSVIFKEPVMSSFLTGIRFLHDSLKESRSGSKALHNQGPPLQFTEYTSRQIQIGAMTLRRLNRGDCGQKRFITVTLAHHDLKYYDGSGYWDDDGKLKHITANSRELVGRPLRMRSILHCRDKDQYGVCEACFGELSNNIPYLTNIGWFASIALNRLISQIILSTKHHDGTATADDITLTDYEKRYIRSSSGENLIWINKFKGCNSAKVVLPKSGAENLPNINVVDDLEQLLLVNVSAMSEIKIILENGTTLVDDPVLNVSCGKRNASLTFNALRYIKEKGWTIDEYGNYVVDITDWDSALPFLILPLKHINMIDYGKAVESMFVGTGEFKNPPVSTGHPIKPFYKYDTVEEALMAFYALVSSKLDNNIKLLEVLMLSMAVRDPGSLDYRLPGENDEIVFAPYPVVITSRSATGKLSYEYQSELFTNPEVFLGVPTASHPMDDLFLP